MAENTTNYQCPACTGPLRFDSASGKLCCDYCGSTYDVAQVEALYSEKQAQADKAAEAAERAASSGPVWGEMETGELSSRTCTSCGAELVCGPETAATTCPYCGNPTVLGGQLSGKLKPEYIIPFRMDKKTAIENLKKYYKGKAFLPKAFKESNHIEEIQGVYVPFWLYDGRMEARGAYKAEISESHREGDYIVTTTRHFDVARVGDADFVRVPVDGSSKMPDTHMDAIEPFDYSGLKPFSTAYLPGFLADRYDEDDKKCAARVLTRMKNSTAAALHDTLGGYTGVQTLSEQLDPRTLEPHYALLPVWMLHTRWKEQDFLFAMNGQTGRLIGDLPVGQNLAGADCVAVTDFPWSDTYFVCHHIQQGFCCKTGLGYTKPAKRSGRRIIGIIGSSFNLEILIMIGTCRMSTCTFQHRTAK